MPTHAAIALSLSLLPGAGARAENPGDLHIDPHVQQVAVDFKERADVPGLTVAVWMPDGSIKAAAVGLARKQPAESMTIGGRMPSGSIGKAYAAATLMRLLEREPGGPAAALDKPISTWLKGRAWFGSLPNAEAITLRQLLVHTSGIPEHVERADFLAALKADPEKTWKTDELAEVVCKGTPHFEPGKGWSYADANYIIVGAIIEELAKHSYYWALKDNVINPLSLENTIPQDRQDLPGIVSGYVGEKNLFPVPEEVAAEGRYAINPQFEFTGGGVVTTAPELAKFFHELFESKLLAEATRKLMVDAAVDAHPLGAQDKYGIGLQVYPTARGMAWGHSGRFPGYVSIAAYFPDKHASVAAQVNCDIKAGMNLRGLLIDTLDAALGGPDVNPDPARSGRDPATPGGN